MITPRVAFAPVQSVARLRELVRNDNRVALLIQRGDQRVATACTATTAAGGAGRLAVYLKI